MRPISAAYDLIGPPRSALYRSARAGLVHSSMRMVKAGRDELATRRSSAMRHRAWSPEAPIKSGRGTSRSSNITLLKGAGRRVFYLYVIINICSSYVVGWLVAAHEREELAHALIDKTFKRRGVHTPASSPCTLTAALGCGR